MSHPILTFLARKAIVHIFDNVLASPKPQRKGVRVVKAAPPMPPVKPAMPDNHGVIRDALKALGYSQQDAIKIVQTLPVDVSVEDGIRMALKRPK
jgi:Holliday junction resolvasome RuvABC DNA-binding subunit